MTPSTHYPKRSDQLHVERIDDEVVILQLKDATVYHLNSTSTLLFDLCDGQFNVSAITTELQTYYDLSEDQASEYVMQLLNDLVSRNLIMISDVESL